MNLQELRTTYGAGMTPEQCAHVEGIIEQFSEQVYQKYARGQHEHGGDLWRKDIIMSELVNETLDFVVYAFTLKQQVEDAGVKLGESLPD